MIVGIDASNIRDGGGVTHLVELLRAAEPNALGIKRIIVWSGRSTLAQIEERPWLEKCQVRELDGTLLRRAFWQRFRLPKAAREASCKILFVPGGTISGGFQPAVTMSRNLLPFEWRELRRFGWSWMTLKLVFLYLTQARSFRHAAGVIFLTRYAREVVMRSIKTVSGEAPIIPHGIDVRLPRPPREQQEISNYSFERPFRILYVSKVDMYKHQWHVADAIAKLRSEGMPVELTLIGPAYPPAKMRLEQTLARIDGAAQFVHYLGTVDRDKLSGYYTQSDLCVFASSCENMPNILLEGMASGLPIACSDRGPMPEMLGNSGAYFDPERPDDIARSLRELIGSSRQRYVNAWASFESAKKYSWVLCAKETLAFLAKVAAASEVH